jgi:DNA-binding IclR family transcriptional regulator
VGVLTLAGGLLDREPLVAAAHGLLEKEAAEFGETFFLVAARAGRLLVSRRPRGTVCCACLPAIGSEMPGASDRGGEALHGARPDLLAHRGADALHGAHDRRLAAPRARRWRHARRDGYALNRQEWIEGLAVVAAPILVGGHASRVPSARRCPTTVSIRSTSTRSRERVMGPRRASHHAWRDRLMKVFIDGQIVDRAEARISVVDHGLLYGDGVFEGMRAHGGVVFAIERHLKRLTHGARALHLELPDGIEGSATWCCARSRRTGVATATSVSS